MLLRATTALAALTLSFAAPAGVALAQLFPQLGPPVASPSPFRPLPPVTVENENLPPYDPPPGYRPSGRCRRGSRHAFMSRRRCRRLDRTATFLRRRAIRRPAATARPIRRRPLSPTRGSNRSNGASSASYRPSSIRCVRRVLSDPARRRARSWPGRTGKHVAPAGGHPSRNRTTQGTAAAVQTNHRRLPLQGAGRHHRGRYAEHVSLSDPRQRQGDALRHRRRPRGLHLGGRRARHPDGRVARLASAGGDDRAPALSAALHGGRRRQSDGRARALSRQDASTASTAPISRRPSARSCRRAASDSPTRTSSISTTA